LAFQIEVFGEYACFTRPEMKVERVSYDVMTPSAARGILEAIYWHPGMKWVINRIHVLSPIRFTNIRRNELPGKISAGNVRRAMNGTEIRLSADTSEHQQRATMVLRDVRYVIDAHFELTDKANPGDNAGKFTDIMRRRLEKGQCYHQPCFGTREFPAAFLPWRGGDIQTSYPGERRDLGFMLYDMDYSDPENITPLFFRAVLENGTLELTDCEVFR